MAKKKMTKEEIARAKKLSKAGLLKRTPSVPREFEPSAGVGGFFGTMNRAGKKTKKYPVKEFEPSAGVGGFFGTVYEKGKEEEKTRRFSKVTGWLTETGQAGVRGLWNLIGKRIKLEIFTTIIIVAIGAIVSMLGFIWAGVAIIIYGFYIFLPNEYQIMAMVREKHYEAKAKIMDKIFDLVERGDVKLAKDLLIKSGTSPDEVPKTINEISKMLEKKKNK